MGVVSNKINIMELMKSGGGGDPTIPGRVSALENEMTGVYASINQISTVELPKVYSSISAVSDLILAPVTGLEPRVEALEQGGGEMTFVHILKPKDGTTATKTLFTEACVELLSIFNNLEPGQTLEPYSVNFSVAGYYKYTGKPYIKGTVDLETSSRLYFTKMNCSQDNVLTLSGISSSLDTTSYNTISSFTVNSSTGAIDTTVSTNWFNTGTGNDVDLCYIIR